MARRGSNFLGRFRLPEKSLTLWAKAKKKEPTSNRWVENGDGTGLLPLPRSSLVDLPELCDRTGKPEYN